MLTIPLNGEPCDTCGQPAFQLSVDVTLIHNGKHYRANCTLPCGCFHAVRELVPISQRDDQRRVAV